jgi:hypothetical protein
MDEAEWLASGDPIQLLEEIRATANASQLWLYVTLCLYGIGADAGVDLLQPHFAGTLEENSLIAMRRNLEAIAIQRSGGSYRPGGKPVKMTAVAQRALAQLAALQPPWLAAVGVTTETRHQLQRSQCDWIRCLLSRRPVTLDPRWLTSTVIDLATAIYEGNAFDRMPILADALMDAGCDNKSIFQHCRSERHTRGCWVINAILEKNEWPFITMP